MDEQVNQAWAEIENQLKRRNDLIPNMVNTVKGYAAHEKEIFIAVADARAKLTGLIQEGGSAEAKIAAAKELQGALGRLLAIAENYPNLKANENFLQLQRELADTEDKIQASRRFYNTNVRDLNTKIQSFPSNVIAGMFRFEPREFFELGGSEAAAREPVKVSF